MADVDNDVTVRAVIGLPKRGIQKSKLFELMGTINSMQIILTLRDKSDIQWPCHQTTLCGIA